MISRIWIVFLGIMNLSILKAFRTFDVNGNETIFAMEHEMINIQCKTEMPMAYCGFIHPNGKRYTFSGPTLNAGQCAIEIQAAKTDSGEWRCHIGSKGSIGVEIMQYIHVRVVEEFAALQKNISVVDGESMTITCVTTEGLVPLRYCRFEPPNDTPAFSINSDVNVTNPILRRYYFPPNKSLDRGDCAVTIRKVTYEDVGTWTCGVGMDDGRGYIDTVSVQLEGLSMMSAASATGITFGAIVVCLTILGFIVWKKRRLLGSVPGLGNEQEMEQLGLQDVEMAPRVSPHGSPKALHVPLSASLHSLPKEPLLAPLLELTQSSQKALQHVDLPKTSQSSSPQSSQPVVPVASSQGSPKESYQPPSNDMPREPDMDSIIPEIVVQSPSNQSVLSDLD